MEKWTWPGLLNQFLADVNGDGKADAIVFFNSSNGKWDVAESTGSSFQTPFEKQVQNGFGSDEQFVANLNKSNEAYFVSYYASDGVWKAIPCQYRQPNIYNTWEGWDINYVPRVGSGFHQYDTLDKGVVDEHLKELGEAGVDFLLLDQTNFIYTDQGYIFERSKHTCNRIKALRDSGERNIPLHASAIGGNQWTKNPRTIEEEAKIIWEQFVEAEDCGGISNYVHVDGKPLLAVYALHEVRKEFVEMGINSKIYSSRFTIKWVQGTIDNTYESHAYYDDESTFLGWAVAYDGSMYNTESMVVMPGCKNKVGNKPVDRTYQDNEGGYYTHLGWDRVKEVVGMDCSKKHMVVINSYNEFAENTAIQESNTDGLESSMRWSRPDFYWNITVHSIQEYKCM